MSENNLPELPNEEKYLSEAEVKQMEIYQLKMQLSNTKTVELKKEIMLLELQKQINLLKNELAAKTVAELKTKVSDELSRLKLSKEESGNFNKQLAQKYQLSEGWGYNPETGQLKPRED